MINNDLLKYLVKLQTVFLNPVNSVVMESYEF